MTELTLTESEFNDYKKLGYFYNIKYRWSMQNYIYTIYLSPKAYDKYLMNRENPGIDLVRRWKCCYNYIYYLRCNNLETRDRTKVKGRSGKHNKSYCKTSNPWTWVYTLIRHSIVNANYMIITNIYIITNIFHLNSI